MAISWAGYLENLPWPLSGQAAAPKVPEAQMQLRSGFLISLFLPGAFAGCCQVFGQSTGAVRRRPLFGAAMSRPSQSTVVEWLAFCHTLACSIIKNNILLGQAYDKTGFLTHAWPCKRW